MIFSHVIGSDKDNYSEKDYMLEFLFRGGAVLLDQKEFKGSSVYYVDTKKY